MKRSGGLKTKTPMKCSSLNRGNSLRGRSPKKDNGEYQFNSTFKKGPSSPKIGIGTTLKSTTALRPRAPLKAKREEPRRRLPERIEQKRVAPKAGEKPNALEKQHMDRVAKMKCLVCGKPSTLHHVTGYADKIGRIRRTHKCVVPLCAMHHQKVFDPINAKPVSVEGLGHQGFYKKHGKDLFAIGNQLWQETLIELRLSSNLSTAMTSGPLTSLI